MVKLDDMRLFAALAEAGSFTAAARRLEIPKQTLSRRIAELEHALATQLVLRTTRRVKLTAAGAQYAARCADVARLADEANRALTHARDALRGPIRITRDGGFSPNTPAKPGESGSQFYTLRIRKHPGTNNLKPAIPGKLPTILVADRVSDGPLTITAVTGPWRDD